MVYNGECTVYSKSYSIQYIMGSLHDTIYKCECIIQQVMVSLQYDSNVK